MSQTQPSQQDSTPERIAQFTLPLGRQEIELKETDLDAGGMSMLRIRIREGKRFTIFDVDPISAQVWARAMLAWAEGAITKETARQENNDGASA